jgi:heptosyltransferase-2
MLEQVLRDCRLMGLPEASAGPAGFSGFLPWQVMPGSAPARPYLVLHAGSKERWQTTRWPGERWSELTTLLLEQTSFHLVFVGTASEQALVQSIAAGGQDTGRITASLSAPLRQTAGLIAAAGGVICHNSGILHLAAFLGAKTACITGSSARYWRPPYPWVKNITTAACDRACNRYRCPIPWYRAKCIHSITVADVWAGLKEHAIIGEGC